MKSTTSFLALTAGAVLLTGATAFAQNTATVNVSATVSAAAKLSINNVTSTSVSFNDADPDSTPTIAQNEAALQINAKAKTSSAGVVTLTVEADGPLTSGTDSIPESAISWTATGTGYGAGTMSTAAVNLGSWTGPGNRNGTQTYRLANSWDYVTGNYTMTVTYTLTAP